MTDTPIMTTDYCPGCEPDVDPVRDPLMQVRWCYRHQGELGGLDDAKVRVADFLEVAEAGGAHNRTMCDLIHRKAAPA